MSAHMRFSTAQTRKHDRSSAWNTVISESYFPLQLQFRNPLEFDGRLSRARLGAASLSRLTSDPVSYERRRHHIQNTHEEEFLVTLPRASAVSFRQMGQDVRCDPGGLILERGDEPYRFMYESPNDLFVLKIGKSALSERVRQPDRYCARVIDATSGTAGLFAAMINHAHSQMDTLSPAASETIGRQLLELLGLALGENADATDSGMSTVRAAHLARVDAFIRANLKRHDLSPELIAEGCGISKRYLHDLFKDVNGTVSQQIRDRRLIAARDSLEASGTVSIAEVAYRFGFSDQARFARLFKGRFGLPPSEFQRQAAGKRRSAGMLPGT